MDNAIHRISIRETNCAIQWIVIYPVDCAIHLLGNWRLMLSGENWCWSLLGPKGLRLCEGVWHFPVSMLSVIMCGSRKYPYPPSLHGRSLEIPRGRGGSKAVISEGLGVHWKLLFQRVTNHKQNNENNVQSIISIKTYVRCFKTKISTPGHWDEVNIISFTTVFLDTRLSKSKHPLKRFQNFRQSYTSYHIWKCYRYCRCFIVCRASMTW